MNILKDRWMLFLYQKDRYECWCQGCRWFHISSSQFEQSFKLMSKARLQETQMGEAMIIYLIREGYWNNLQSYCGQNYNKTSDPLYLFWRAFAQHQLGNTSAAINDLLSIQQKKQVSYACIVALLFYQNQARNIDREQIDNLRTRERQQRRNAAERAITQAIYFFTFVGESRKANDLIEEKGTSGNIGAAAVWNYIVNGAEEEGMGSKTDELVDRLWEEKDKHLPKASLFLARSTHKNTKKKHQQALETLNEGIVYYPVFLPFMTEKLICLMALGEWEEFQQAALEVSQRDQYNIKAITALTFYELAREGHAESSLMRMRQLESVINKRENRSTKLLFEIAQLFLRVCGRNQKVIEYLRSMVQKCRKSDPVNADYAIEQGRQFIMLGKIDDAYRSFQEATSLDQSKLESIAGMIECKLLQEDFDDAENQIEFVNVMQQTIGRTPIIAYLEAVLTLRKARNAPAALAQAHKILDGALKMQISYSRTLPPGFNYYAKLNPDFLFAVSELYLQGISMKEMNEGAESPSSTGPVGKGIKLLQSITKQIPGFLPAYLLLAKGKLAVGSEADASSSIANVLDMDPRNDEGSILQSLIRSKRRQFDAALNSLQEAISINFKIRENPLFMLIKGGIQYQMQDYITAEQTMVAAAALPSVKRRVTDPNMFNFKVLTFNEKDRCSIFLLLAKCYSKNKKNKESKTVITQAIGQFAGTSEEVHVSLANATISVESGDIKKAMSILRAVKSDSPYFVESRKLLADIHLKHLKNRKGYAKCYYEIIEAVPTFQNFKIYGDGLIKINQPQEATVAYEKAYEERSDHEGIIRDLGRAYALAHNYQKATKFYEDNIQKLNRPDLILDLAKLCVQLRRYDRAEQLLTSEIFSEQTGPTDRLKQNVDANFHLYKLYIKKQGPHDLSTNEKARKYIKTATQLQKMVIQKLRSEGSSAQQEKMTYADFYYQIAKYTHDYEKNVDTTILMLNQCLKIYEEHEKALQLLAALQLRQGNLERSEELCRVLLKVNPKNDIAGSILAQILLKSNQYDKAMEQFQKMLEQEPDKYSVLAKLIDFFRRNNQLDQAKNYIQNAQNRASNANDAGLCYCRGLYHKFSRNPSDALVQFNKAKKSSQYAQQALTHMIDIFLCPDQDFYFSALEGRVKPVHPENIRICESLLREMSNRASTHRYIVMEAYVHMLGGKVKNIEEIIRKLVQVLSTHSEYPPAMFAIAIAKFLAGKDVEATNFLKLCAKITYQPQYGQQLEKAWLLHAQSYVKIQKYDNAEQLLRMLMKQNRSCGKAQQLMGLIREKESAFADAAEFYQKAFNLTSRKSAGIGYRLAYNYMKAKRFIDCLQICRQVTEAFPNYTAIKTEIEEKVISSIR